MKLKWAVFISGNGSNLQTLLDQHPTEVQVSLVVSSRASAFGLQRAEKFHVPTFILPKTLQQEDWSQLTEVLLEHKIDRIFLLGFLKVLPACFVKYWHGKILNLHPSILPAYPGLKSIERSYDDNAPMGVTVHWVTEGLDEGPILLQETLFNSHPKEKCSLEIAHEKIHELEHQLVLKAVQKCQSQHES